MTEQKTTVVTTRDALAAVMQDIKSIRKGGWNSFHKFNFRGVEQVMDHIGPAFRRHGIVPTPHVVDLQSRDVTTKKGDVMREVTVLVRYVFHGPAGDSVECTVPGEAQDSSASAVSKAMSVAQRIAYTQVLAIPTGEADPEAVAAFERAESDPATAVKRAIWVEAQRRGWVGEADSYTALSDDFAEWSQGGDLDAADLEMLTKYRDHLVPPKKIQRGQR